MTAHTLEALRALSEAEALLDRTDPGTAGRWPRMASLLGRQALELAMSEFWMLRAPGVQHATGRGQFLCLPTYFGDRQLALDVFDAWSSLSHACHYDAYELGPTAGELRRWLNVVRDFVEHVTRQADGTR